MVKINIVCVGKIKEKYYAEAVAEYVKRLSRFAEVSVIECKEENFVKEPSAGEIPVILSKEGVQIKKNLKGYVFAMAIEGKKMSSEDFANKIRSLTDSGEGVLTFVIGGSYGIDEEIKRQADYRFSFSDMTFPHTLMRVMLTEQIYRAFMINADSNYHK